MTTLIVRDQLITDHLDLVNKLAKVIRDKLPANTTIDIEDLIQEGNLALIKQAESYISEKSQFPYWAKQRIWGAMVDWIRSECRHANVVELDCPRSRLPGELDYLHDLEFPRSVPTHENVLIAREIEQERKARLRPLHERVRNVVVEMPQRDQRVLTALYSEDKSQSEIGKELHLGQQRVSQIKAKAFRKLGPYVRKVKDPNAA